VKLGCSKSWDGASANSTWTTISYLVCSLSTCLVLIEMWKFQACYLRQSSILLVSYNVRITLFALLFCSQYFRYFITIARQKVFMNDVFSGVKEWRMSHNLLFGPLPSDMFTSGFPMTVLDFSFNNISGTQIRVSVWSKRCRACRFDQFQSGFFDSATFLCAYVLLLSFLSNRNFYSRLTFWNFQNQVECWFAPILHLILLCCALVRSDPGWQCAQSADYFVTQRQSSHVWTW